MSVNNIYRTFQYDQDEKQRLIADIEETGEKRYAERCDASIPKETIKNNIPWDKGYSVRTG